MSVSASLSISHPFLVLQVYVPQGSSIGVELTIRDNLNVSKLGSDKIRLKEDWCFVRDFEK